MVLRRCLVLALLALSIRDASGKAWPQPAAGESASGDVEVVLTFDDGPNPITTPQVLDILAAHHLKAVFFLVGVMIDPEDKRIPGILDRMIREGHIIGNHTQHHKDPCRAKETDQTAIDDLDGGKRTIEAATHLDLGWVRVPYGARCDRIERLLADRHLKHFHWDLDPQEWKHGNLKRTVGYVTTELSRAGGRVVLLMHDIKRVTVKALPEILKFIDEENARREKSHRAKIRIIQAPDLAIEQLPKGFPHWASEATAQLRALPRVVVSLLP